MRARPCFHGRECNRTTLPGKSIGLPDVSLGEVNAASSNGHSSRVPTSPTHPPFPQRRTRRCAYPRGPITWASTPQFARRTHKQVRAPPTPPQTHIHANKRSRTHTHTRHKQLPAKRPHQNVHTHTHTHAKSYSYTHPTQTVSN